MVAGGMFAILESLTGGEVLIVLFVALLVLGPERLPDTARTMGHWMARLRKMSSNLQSEVREVLDDPAMKPIRDVGEFVAAPRKKLMEFATEAESEIASAEAQASAVELAGSEEEALEATGAESAAEPGAETTPEPEAETTPEPEAASTPEPEFEAAAESEPAPAPTPELDAGSESV